MNKASKRFKQEDILKECNELYNLNDIHNRLLEMLAVYDDFCRQHNLTYYLAGGTLLGAIRDKGFIPWDDDVDVFMPREDYEKFLQYSEIAPDMAIVSFKNDHGYYHPYPYCNIADRKTIMVEHHTRKPTGKGLFLDVFPLDNVPDNLKERKRYYTEILFFRYLKGIQSSPLRKVTCFKDAVINILSVVLTPLDEFKLVNKMDRLARKYENCETKSCGQLMVLHPSKVTWQKSWYENTAEVPFESHNMLVPADFDEILRAQYGDYMQRPPVSEQVCHHGVDIYTRK